MTGNSQHVPTEQYFASGRITRAGTEPALGLVKGCLRTAIWRHQAPTHLSVIRQRRHAAAVKHGGLEITDAVVIECEDTQINSSALFDLEFIAPFRLQLGAFTRNRKLNAPRLHATMMADVCISADRGGTGRSI
ncbi:hypothetical protein [Rhodanobacter sp. C06]|uniref:hypothetical protein n=1 Tax=Rhodanobacter sp. C06 TaxID=1945854 RepID=UPI0011159F06|nr:hypothetical protein [Rhodanobacter sp. C06]